MRNRSSGFTLIELLVVMTIISLLIAILLPSLSKAREAGRAAVCLNQQKQLDLAFSNYAYENKTYLPSYANSVTTNLFWWVRIGPFVNLPAGATVGLDYMVCPSRSEQVSPYNYSYGVNYGFGSNGTPGVFGYEGPNLKGSLRIDDITRNTFISCDSVGMAVYNMGLFVPDVDRDGDGIKDSYSAFVPNYNAFIARHDDSAVFTFIDGSAHRVARMDFVQNKNKVWGP